MHKSSSNDIFIIGASGFAVEVYSWLMASKITNITGFVVKDNDDLVSPINNIPCYFENELIAKEGDAYIAIADPKIRRLVADRLKLDSKLKFPNLFHPTALVDSSCEYGEGNLVMPFSVICPRTTIGSFNIINIYASVAHDANLGDFNTLSPYATLNGSSCCNNLCFLGSHATLAPGITMNNGSLLSANSFCKRDIPENSMAFGVPAKIR